MVCQRLATKKNSRHPERANANERPSKGKANRESQAIKAVDVFHCKCSTGRPVTSTRDQKATPMEWLFCALDTLSPHFHDFDGK